MCRGAFLYDLSSLLFLEGKKGNENKEISLKVKYCCYFHEWHLEIPFSISMYNQYKKEHHLTALVLQLSCLFTFAMQSWLH